VSGEEQKARFAIELDEEMSSPAIKAARGLKDLEKQIEGDTKALAAMQKAMRNLQGAQVVNIKQFRALQDQITNKKNAIAQAQGAIVMLGGSFTGTASKGQSLQDRLAALAKQGSMMGGPLAGMIAGFQKFAALVGGGFIAAGLVAIVAGLVLLVAATASATLALTKYGVAQADARRSELLRLEGLTKLRNWYGIAAGNAKEMQEGIDRVAASSALSREKIAGYNDQLYRMGLRGNNLAAALEGVAIKASVQGEAQANMFANWAAGANLTGQSVTKLADNVKARLGGIAQKQMESLTVQTQKQQESFAALFSELKIDQWLKARKSIVDLFSQSTASGRALKQLLTILIQPLVNSATAAAPLIKRFFQGMILGAQAIVIAVLQARAAFRRTFGSGDVTKGIDLTNAALTAGKVAVGLFAAGLTTAAIATVGLGVKMTSLLVPAMWKLVTATASLAFEGLVLAAPFLLAAAALWGLYQIGKLFYTVWKEIDWTDLGRTVWQGLVNGIKSGATWVVKEVKDLGGKAASAFKSALGISSPSKVFMRHGLAISHGVATGVDSGAPKARRSVDAMAKQDLAPGAPRLSQGLGREAATRSQGSAGARSVTINGGVHVHMEKGKDSPAEIVQSIRRELESMLEGVALEMGAPVTGGT